MSINIKEYFSLGVNPYDDPIGIGPQVTPYTSEAGFYGILSVIFKNVFVIVGIILFIFIIVGGLGMIINAGNTEKQKQSSKTLGSAVTGFIIIMTAYWLIKIIEILTGTQIISL
jgi:hypothetical protein